MLATAEWLRHAMPVPFVLVGLAFVVWARPIAKGYHAAFGGPSRMERRLRAAYEEPGGPAFVRFIGVLFAAVAVYWAIVGTG